MNIRQRTDAFIKLGLEINEFITNTEQKRKKHFLAKVLENQEKGNPWFTHENLISALAGIAFMLNENLLYSWIQSYPRLENKEDKTTIAIIMAGNIPAVGFHDFLCTLLSGNRALIRLSSRDDKLIPALADMLIEIEPLFSRRIKFTRDPLKGFNKIIATGSSNTGRYFDFYFGEYPHIIRKNRSSIAVLTGKESPEDFAGLYDDAFRYFGMGCRNVSKIYIPHDFNVSAFQKNHGKWHQLILHSKYNNNYLYNRSIMNIENERFIDCSFFLLQENKSLNPPLSVIYYELYSDLNSLKQSIEGHANEIQCIVSNKAFFGKTTSFGKTQSPGPADYADNMDIMDFLLESA